MKKLLFLLTLFFIAPFVIQAATTPTPTTKTTKPSPTEAVKQTGASTKGETLAKPALQWHCLQNVRCSDVSAGCATGADVVAGHRIKLTTKTGDLPEKNSPTYIFVCLSTPQGNICTSQNGQLDVQMLGYDGLKKLKELVGYEPQGVFAPKSTTKLTLKEIESIKANQFGKLTLNNKLIEGMEMQDYTPAGQARKWLALNLVDSVNLPTAKGGDQQGTFTFEGALAQCIAISWDPYGIVFDSQSLEPISGVTVTLNRKRPNNLYTIFGGDEAGSILNPQTTVEDGGFSFYVPDGIYRLDVAKSGFIFPNVKPMDQNYKKIYSDIYHGEDIIQKGAIQHRDIPVDSKGAPFTSPVKVLTYFTMLNKVASEYIVQGRVSHPLTAIKVYGKKPVDDSKNSYNKTRLLLTSNANQQGQFNIKIDLKKLDPTEVVGDIDFIKPDYKNLTSKTLDETKKATLIVEPILNFVEGIAYDDFGKPLVNATVGVYLNQANKPIYEVKTDDKGYYKISSEFLPPMSFGLRYSAPSGAIYSVPAAKFVAQNSKYIEDKNEKVYAYSDQNGNTVEAAKNNSQSGLEMSDNNRPAPTTQELEEKTGSNNTFMILAVVLVMVGVIGIVLAFYLIKKKEQGTTL